MADAIRLPWNEEPSRTYRTTGAATGALRKACEAAGMEGVRYLIAAGANGTYFPVVLPKEDEVAAAVGLAHKGFMVVRV